jgi:hypothetical protein
MKSWPNKKDGLVALTAVLITGSVILIISLTASLTSFVNSQIALSFRQGARSLSLANACVERAIWELRQNSGYLGNQEFVIDDGDACFVDTIQSWGDNGRIINATATVGDYSKSVEVYLSAFSPEVVVYSWED